MAREAFDSNNVVSKVKGVLQEVADKQKHHDFNTTMAVRAERTAELYQIIDAIGRDESKFEILELKQKIRDRIQMMEKDIKDQVFQLIEESKKSDKYKNASNFPHEDLRVHSAKQTPVKKDSTTKYHSSALHVPFISENFKTRSQNISALEKSNPVLPSHNYNMKPFILSTHPDNYLQNPYFYPLAQPSRLKKEYISVKEIFANRENKGMANFNIWKNHQRIITTSEFDKEKRIFQNDINPELYNKSHDIGLINKQQSVLKTVQKNKLQKDKLEKEQPLIYKNQNEQNKKNKYVQTEKLHLQMQDSSSTFDKNKFSKSKKHTVSFGKKHIPKEVNNHKNKNSWDVERSKAKKAVHLSKRYRDNQKYDRNEGNFSVDNETKPKNAVGVYVDDNGAKYVSKHTFSVDNNIQYISERRLQSDIDYEETSMNYVTVPSSQETEIKSQYLSDPHVSAVLSRFLSSLREEQPILSLYPSVVSLLEQKDVPNVDDSTPEIISEYRKHLFEKLVVDVIHDDLHNLCSEPNEQNVKIPEQDNPEEQIPGQDNPEEQKSESEKDKSEIIKPSFEVILTNNATDASQVIELDKTSVHEEDLRNSVSSKPEPPITPELTPLNSSSSSLSAESPVSTPIELPPTPSFSEQENSASEELLQKSYTNIKIEPSSPVITPDFTPQSHFPEHLSTPLPSSTHCTTAEPQSNLSNKKLMQDIAIQTSKLSNSAESTLMTITNSTSESTDDNFSEGEILFRNHNQTSVLDRRILKSSEPLSKTNAAEKYSFDKSVSQNFHSSVSEGEIRLISIDKSFYNRNHERGTDNIDKKKANSMHKDEQSSEDVSEGQIVLKSSRKFIKSFNLYPNSYIKSVQELSLQTMSEGEEHPGTVHDIEMSSIIDFGERLNQNASSVKISPSDLSSESLPISSSSNMQEEASLSKSIECFNIDEEPVKDSSNIEK